MKMQIVIDIKNWKCDGDAKMHEVVTEAIKALEQEPCEDCIDRKTLGLTDFEIIMCDGNYKTALEMLLKKIKDAPSVTPQLKTGYWVYIGNSEVNGLKICKCSNCEKKTYGSHNFCPNCGAKMQEVEE